MKRILIAVAAIALLVGCGSTKIEYVPVETIKTITETLRDTIVDVRLVPYKEEVETEADSSYLENPYAYSFAFWDGLKLRHSLGIFDKPIPSRVQYLDRIVEIEVEKPYPVKGDTVYVNKLSWWQSTLVALGVLMVIQILILTGLGVFKVIRFVKGKAG